MCSFLAQQKKHLPLYSVCLSVCLSVCITLLCMLPFRIINVVLLTDQQLSSFIMCIGFYLCCCCCCCFCCCCICYCFTYGTYPQYNFKRFMQKLIFLQIS